MVIGIIGLGVGYLIRKYIAEAKIQSAEEAAQKIIDDAHKEASAKSREVLLEAKEEAHKIRNDIEKECRERRAEFQSSERRLLQREELLDRKSEFLEKKDIMLSQREMEIDKIKESVSQLEAEHRRTLENLAGMKAEEAKDYLLQETEKEVRQELALLIKELESQAKAEAEKRSRDIVSLAIQRYAADHVAETTVSVVSLPNDEMKGRIIGREGRNIRAFETLTGVDLIIDDTPEAVIISGFDAIRREVAKIALEKLIVDGRIHPARIEEMVAKAQREVEAVIREEGEQAIFEVGLQNVHPELIKLLGKLRFRTSYGQNVLKHSLEVAHLAGIMAAELGADVALAKRGGLLHDIGKAANHDVEGTHVQIGFELAKKYKESSDVCHVILSHHNDVEPTSIEAVLVQAADSLSAARPGARRETLEAYVRRLEKLESIADSFDSVEKAYAIQAGREIRIMVRPEAIDDVGAVKIARDIVKKIEEEMEFPGQIKVTVIRETRAVDYAK